MAVTKDSVATVQVTCTSCGERLRYNPKTDPKLPPRDRSGIPSDLPNESSLFREIVCPTCAQPIVVPIPDDDPHYSKWMEVREQYGPRDQDNNAVVPTPGGVTP